MIAVIADGEATSTRDESFPVDVVGITQVSVAVDIDVPVAHLLQWVQV